MSNILLDLDSKFRVAVEATLKACATNGFELRPYFALRTPDEQARFWRQSRAREEIRDRIAELRAASAFFLAACLERVGPQSGPHVTNAIPGLSWHQWGEAVDCVVVEGGKAIWNTKHPGWAAYGAAAKANGLDAGMFWSKFKDFPHIQLRKAASPLEAGMTIQQVDAAMKERWGG